MAVFILDEKCFIPIEQNNIREVKNAKGYNELRGLQAIILDQ